MVEHRNGDLAAASTHYRAILARDPNWPGAPLLLAVAALEQDPTLDLGTLPGITPAQCTLLAIPQALLTGTPLKANPADAALISAIHEATALSQAESEAVAALWHGLILINAGQGQARSALEDHRSPPTPRLAAIRRFYRGVAAAQAGDSQLASKLWQETYEKKIFTAALFDNLGALLFQQLNQLRDAGDLAGAAALAFSSVAMPFTNAALHELRIRTLDQAAYAAAERAEWQQAVSFWEAARQLVSAHASLGSPRPLLHSLALAYEMLEQWIEAADAWRALLRTRPRKRSDESDPAALSDAQWSWARTRIIECYKSAGRPDEAVTVFRQMIKAEPEDISLRLQLAHALLANEQEQAASNEVQRILEREPHNPDALVRQSAFLHARHQWAEAEQVLRDAITHNPERPELRSYLASTLLVHAKQYLNYRNYAAATKALTEGQELEPENYEFPLHMAQALFNQNKKQAGRELLVRVLELAGDRPEPFIAIFHCWVIEEDLDEARALVARAAGTLTKQLPEFYTEAGLLIFTEMTPEPQLNFNPFLFQRPKPVKREIPQDTPWTCFGVELLEQATALRPNDGRISMVIATNLMEPRPDLALRYAEQGAQLLPDDPNALITYGLIQGLNEKKREAKETLKQASQMARKQGNTQLAEQANSLRREIDNPLFSTLFQMRGLFKAFGMDDLDDMDIGDIF